MADKKEKPKMSPEERAQKRAKDALERNARVFFVNNQFTHTVLNLAQMADKATNNIRSRMGTPGGPSFEDGMKALDRYTKLVTEFNELTKELCDLGRITYRAPRGMEEEKPAK